MARAKRRQYSLFMNTAASFLPLQEANLLWEARCFWSIERPQLWFESIWGSEEFSALDDYWRQEFRFSKATFQEVIQIVRRDLEKGNTNFRQAIPIQKRVAIALWRLSTGNSYRSTAAVFGVGKSTAVQITNKFCKSIVKVADNFIKFPKTERETAIAIEKFAEVCKIPQVIGAIDATHVPIVAPPKDPVDCFCRKQMYTINTQAVVDADMNFIDISSGFLGSVHDARVLRASAIFNQAENGQILTRPTLNIENLTVKPMIIGDGAYPLSTWLLKPFPDNGALTRQQTKFNRTLSSARSIVGRAFGLLKVCWRCLLKET